MIGMGLLLLFLTGPIALVALIAWVLIRSGKSDRSSRPVDSPEPEFAERFHRLEDEIVSQADDRT
jgi:hypothetical protein